MKKHCVVLDTLSLKVAKKLSLITSGEENISLGLRVACRILENYDEVEFLRRSEKTNRGKKNGKRKRDKRTA